MAKDDAAKVEKALATWPACNEFLRKATELQAYAALTAERDGKRRVQFLLRLHARFNRLRAQRERAELLKASGGRK